MTSPQPVKTFKKSAIPGVLITQFVNDVPEGCSTPDFERKPLTLTLQEGKNAIFRAVVKGVPTPEVKWSRTRKGMDDPAKYEMSFNSATNEFILQINRLVMDDSDLYRCCAVNEYGEASCSVGLRIIQVGFKRKAKYVPVHAADELKKTLQDSKKLLRKRVVAPKPKPLDKEAVWQLLLHADRRDYEKICIKYGIVDFRGMLRKLQELRKDTESEQDELIHSIKNLEHIKVNKEGNATFSLEMELKNKNSNVYLLKDGQRLRYGTGDEYRKHCLRRIGRRYHFIINDVQPEDAGVYQVRVEDVPVFSTELDAEAIPARFQQPLSDLRCPEQGDAVFRCVLRTPCHHPAWLHKTHALQAGPRHHISVSPDGLTHQLTIKKVEPSDSGMYTLEAGQGSSSAWLLVEYAKGKKRQDEEGIEKIERETSEWLKETMADNERARKLRRQERAGDEDHAMDTGVEKKGWYRKGQGSGQDRGQGSSQGSSQGQSMDTDDGSHIFLGKEGLRKTHINGGMGPGQFSGADLDGDSVTNDGSIFGLKGLGGKGGLRPVHGKDSVPGREGPGDGAGGAGGRDSVAGRGEGVLGAGHMDVDGGEGLGSQYDKDGNLGDPSSRAGFGGVGRFGATDGSSVPDGLGPDSARVGDGVGDLFSRAGPGAAAWGSAAGAAGGMGSHHGKGGDLTVGDMNGAGINRQGQTGAPYGKDGLAPHASAQLGQGGRSGSLYGPGGLPSGDGALPGAGGSSVGEMEAFYGPDGRPLGAGAGGAGGSGAGGFGVPYGKDGVPAGAGVGGVAGAGGFGSPYGKDGLPAGAGVGAAGAGGFGVPYGKDGLPAGAGVAGAGGFGAPYGKDGLPAGAGVGGAGAIGAGGFGAPYGKDGLPAGAGAGGAGAAGAGPLGYPYGKDGIPAGPGVGGAEGGGFGGVGSLYGKDGLPVGAGVGAAGIAGGAGGVGSPYGKDGLPAGAGVGGAGGAGAGGFGYPYGKDGLPAGAGTGGAAAGFGGVGSPYGMDGFPAGAGAAGAGGGGAPYGKDGLPAGAGLGGAGAGGFGASYGKDGLPAGAGVGGAGAAGAGGFGAPYGKDGLPVGAGFGAAGVAGAGGVGALSGVPGGAGTGGAGVAGAGGIGAPYGKDGVLAGPSIGGAPGGGVGGVGATYGIDGFPDGAGATGVGAFGSPFGKDGLPAGAGVGGGAGAGGVAAPFGKDGLPAGAGVGGAGVGAFGSPYGKDGLPAGAGAGAGGAGGAGAGGVGSPYGIDGLPAGAGGAGGVGAAGAGGVGAPYGKDGVLAGAGVGGAAGAGGVGAPCGKDGLPVGTGVGGVAGAAGVVSPYGMDGLSAGAGVGGGAGGAGGIVSPYGKDGLPAGAGGAGVAGAGGVGAPCGKDGLPAGAGVGGGAGGAGGVGSPCGKDGLPAGAGVAGAGGIVSPYGKDGLPAGAGVGVAGGAGVVSPYGMDGVPAGAVAGAAPFPFGGEGVTGSQHGRDGGLGRALGYPGGAGGEGFSMEGGGVGGSAVWGTGSPYGKDVGSAGAWAGAGAGGRLGGDGRDSFLGKGGVGGGGGRGGEYGKGIASDGRGSGNQGSVGDRGSLSGQGDVWGEGRDLGQLGSLYGKDSAFGGTGSKSWNRPVDGSSSGGFGQGPPSHDQMSALFGGLAPASQRNEEPDLDVKAKDLPTNTESTAQKRRSCLDDLKVPRCYLNKQLATVRVVKGEPAELSCTVSKDDVTGTWFKDGLKLTSMQGVVFEKKGLVHKLIINKAEDIHAGKYRFEGGDVKTEASIFVEDPPQVDKVLLKNLSSVPTVAKAGQAVKLRIPFEGRLPIRATWLKDKMELADDTRIRVDKTDTHTTLSIPSCDRRDCGDYKVRLKNDSGVLEINLKLVVIDKPQPPAGPIKIVESSANAITIRWQPPKDDGGKPVQRYLVERQQAGKNDWETLGDTPRSCTTFTTNKVEEDTSYYFRVRAVNVEGTSDALESGEVKAAGKASPGAPDPPEIVSASRDTVTISWKAPRKTGASQIVGYIVQKRKKGTMTWLPVTNGPVKDKKLKVTNLKKGVQYEFRVAAVNAAGTGDASDPSPPVFARDPTKSPGQVQELRVSSCDSTSVTLTWSRPEVKDGNEVKGYEVEMRPSHSSSWTKCLTLPAEATTGTIKGLQPKEKYFLRVRALNDSGPGEAAELEAVAEAAAPAVPPRLLIDDTVKNLLVVRAGNPIRVNIPFEGSPEPAVLWLKDGLPLPDRAAVKTQDGSTRLLIGAAELGDSGCYSVELLNGLGKRETFSFQVQITDIPQPPGPLRLEENVPNTVTVTWEPSASEKWEKNLYYTVLKRESQKGAWRMVGDLLYNNKFTFTSVIPGRDYYFRVVAKNSLGASAPSETVQPWRIRKAKAEVWVRPQRYRGVNQNQHPRFLVPLKPHVVVTGSECHMSCAVGGHPPPKVTWYKDNRDLSNDPNYFCTNDFGVCSLVILGVTKQDAGEYMVEASNEVGRVSSRAFLAIKDSAL